MQALAAVLQQRLAQTPTVQEKHVERAHSSKVPWLVVSPDGVCSVAHKISVAPTDKRNDDVKHGKQLVRLATQLCTCILACEHAYCVWLKYGINPAASVCRSVPQHTAVHVFVLLP